MRKVEDLLVVGVAMNGVHVAALNTKVLEQHLGNRSQAVRSARSVGNDVVRFLVVIAVVHAHDDGDVFALGRARDDDLLGTSVDMPGSKFARLEDAGGFNNDVDAELAPGQVLGIALAEHLGGMAIGHKAVFGNLDRVKCAAVDGIVFQQMGHRGNVAQVVNRNNIELGIVRHRAIDETTDTAKAVDANLDCHVQTPFLGALLPRIIGESDKRTTKSGPKARRAAQKYRSRTWE